MSPLVEKEHRSRDGIGAFVRSEIGEVCDDGQIAVRADKCIMQPPPLQRVRGASDGERGPRTEERKGIECRGHGSIELEAHQQLWTPGWHPCPIPIMAQQS